MSDLHNLRGMSEPLAFAFNLLDPKKKTMLVHAVIFTSYTAGDETVIHLATPEDDPRMASFINYCMSNYGKKAKDALAEAVKKGAEEVDQIERKIIELKRELKNVRP